MMQTSELFLEIWTATLGADIMYLQTCDLLLLDIIKDTVVSDLLKEKKSLFIEYLPQSKF